MTTGRRYRRLIEWVSNAAGTKRDHGRLKNISWYRTAQGYVSFSIQAVGINPLFAHHIGVESERAVLFGLPIDSLDLDVEAWKQIGAPLEHFQIVQHRARALVEPLARDDGGDARRIDHKHGGGDSAGHLIDRYI